MATYNWKVLLEVILNKKMDLANKILSSDIVESKVQESFKKTVLFCIVGLGYEDVLIKILNKKVKVNICDIAGYTPLMYACSKNDEYINIVKILIERGAEINEKSKNDETALTIACENNNVHIVEFLLKNGALDLRSKKETSLIIAIKKGYTDVIKLLVKYRKDMINKSYMGETPLMIACEWADVDIVELLLRNGAMINEINIIEETVLHYALQNKKYAKEIIISLLDNGVDIAPIQKNNKIKNFIDSIKDVKLETVLQFRLNKLEGIKNLLNDLDENNKETCLVCLMNSCVFNNQLENIKSEFREFLKENSDIVHTIIEGCKNSKCHKEYKFNFNIMMELAYVFCIIGDLDIIKLLVGMGVDINKKDKNEISLLMYSCKENKLDVAKYLLELDVDVNDIDLNKNTALMYAAKNCNTEIAKILIQHGAKVNMADKLGETPLMIAIDRKNADLVEYLLESGADMDVKASDGKGILNYAVNSGDIKIVNLLQKYMLNKINAQTKKEFNRKVSIISNFEKIKKNKNILNKVKVNRES